MVKREIIKSSGFIIIRSIKFYNFLYEFIIVKKRKERQNNKKKGKEKTKKKEQEKRE